MKDKNREENNMWQGDFEKLNSTEQLRILQGSYDIISQRVNNEINAGVRTGNLEVVDICYNKTKDGEVIFDIIILDKTTGKETHEFYDSELDKIEIDKDKIDSLKATGSDTSLLEEEYDKLEGLKDNPNKISLTDSKIIENQVKESAQALGVSEREIVYASTIDANNELKLKADSLGGSPTDRIQGNEVITSHYNVNDVLNEDFEAYQIIKITGGTYKLMGIDKNGYAQEIGQDKVEYLTGSNSVSLMQDNGNVVDAHVLCAFRVKSSSDIDREQVIGLCDDGSVDKTTFYGRGALSSEKMIGEQIPDRTHSEERVKQEQIMDTLYTPSVENTDVIAEIAEKYDMDKEDLLDAVIDEYNGKDFNELTREDIINVADYESRIPNRSERSAPENPPRH